MIMREKADRAVRRKGVSLIAELPEGATEERKVGMNNMSSRL